MSQTKAPIHRIRIGRVSVSIFQNRTDDEKTFYNTQFDRSYRDGDGWSRTKSFGRDDLLVLSKLSDLAHTWIVEQQQKAAFDADDED